MNLSIPQKIQSQIEQELQHISSTKQIDILLACESGSRAWGFASPDSDFDVRIVYVHKINHYLSITHQKDHLNYFLENDLDINGWDLKKFLHLLLKSNATPFEWLQSPIIYSINSAFKTQIWKLAQNYFQPKATMHHYLGLAQNAFRKGLVSEYEINIKKYFYVLRPLLAAMWIAKHKAIPPMNFTDLMPIIKEFPHIQSLILDLWKQKINAKEGANTPLIPELVNFMEQQVEMCFDIADQLTKKEVEVAPLNDFFYSLLTNHR